MILHDIVHYFYCIIPRSSTARYRTILIVDSENFAKTFYMIFVLRLHVGITPRLAQNR